MIGEPIVRNQLQKIIEDKKAESPHFLKEQITKMETRLKELEKPNTK